VPHGGDGKLSNAADAHAGHEEDAATPDLGDDTAVDDDDDDAGGGQDAGVHEGVADLGDLEEVGSVCCAPVRFASPISWMFIRCVRIEKGLVRTNHKHRATGGLDANSSDTQQHPPPVNRVPQNVYNAHAARHILLRADSGLDLVNLVLYSLFAGAHPHQGPVSLCVAVLVE
jgi:hypothetical protein